MKLKKTLLFIVALCCMLPLSSCSKDSKGSSADSLVGMWKLTKSSEVIEFIDGSSVITYGSSSKSKTGNYSAEFPGHSGWYYCSSSKKIRTYVRSDNKVVIADYNVYTYLDGNLYPEGFPMDDHYERW